jgi:hypothetical protein
MALAANPGLTVAVFTAEPGSKPEELPRELDGDA